MSLIFKNIFVFPLFFLFFIPINEAASIKNTTDSVVKVFVASNSIDYYRPWQAKGIKGSSGSGAIIKGNKILTNAHVVADQTFIQVRKDSDPKKYTARVEVTGHDCDLALLSVDDPDFFKGTVALDIGQLPQLQDSVMVLGYPQGGDKISITEGVVSRVEITSYSQSGRQLLTVQIDAAINPGNSGGPVIQDGKLVGIAMQVLNSGQNIGYMIPVPVIDHFLKDLEDKQYDGFPLLGIEFSNTENDALRKYFGLQQESGGVLVSSILPFSPAAGYLEEEDIVLSINDIPIGEDGTFSFRAKERLTLSYLITQHQIGEDLRLKVIRKGEPKEIILNIKPFEGLVPSPAQLNPPPYYIYGGLVFTVLSIDLLKSWGNRWWEKAPVEFNSYLMGANRLNLESREEVVVLLNVLPDDINVGYHSDRNAIIDRVNGKNFASFKEFIQLLSFHQSQEKYTVIEATTRTRIILDNTNIDQINAKILKRNNIPAQFSEEVGGWLKN
ncbi:hypothetical protein MNBD_UNCLBAC01-713 [hydrothermal vent metagenome]|uniref:PDZ domain-containing protein n=1 Tax=hydrothermal vent metagenome TaxID=652676 RepID=A0A3B1D2L3_9ZZZZ